MGSTLACQLGLHVRSKSPSSMRLGRNVLLGVDTAVVAATNALILILSARLLPPEDLPTVTMLQLLVVTIVGLQRATILTPAFATHRGTGKTVIPVRWTVLISLPVSVAWSAVMPLMVPRQDNSFILIGALAFAAALPALIQDLLRYTLFTRGRSLNALISDVVYLVAFCGLTGTLLLSARLSWEGVVLAWSASGAIASLVAACLVLAQRSDGLVRARLRDVLHFGRWSGADAGLSGAANLLPMVVSTLALGSPVASVYRILQAANGPFNILSATLITSAGMDAWKLADGREVRLLRRRARKQSLMLAAMATVFYAVAYPTMLALAGLSGSESLRVAIILGVSGILGAATIPINAAASAMGMQRVGFVIRVLVVGSAVLISVAAVVGVWIPWADPVGVVAIISSVCGLLGWYVGYERGVRRDQSRDI